MSNPLSSADVIQAATENKAEDSGSLSGAGTLTGTETVPVSRGAGKLQTTTAAIAALSSGAGVAPIANGTSTAAGTLTGAEIVPLSRGTGLLQTTTAAIAALGGGTAAVAPIANGTSTAAGTLTGAEIIPLSRGAGLLQTTLTLAAQWCLQTYKGFTAAVTGALARTVTSKMSDRISLLDFYTTGTTDDLALSAALTSCQATGKQLVIPNRGTAYAITSTKIWDPTLHGIEFEPGAIIDASGIPSPASYTAPVAGVWGAVAPTPALWVRGLISNQTALYRDRVNELNRLSIKGATKLGVVGVYFGDVGTSTTYTSSGITLTSPNIDDFDIGVAFGNNSYCNDFYSPNIWNCNTCWFFPANRTNSGENLKLVGGSTYNSGIAFDLSACEFHVFGHSFDYNTYQYICRDAAQLYITSGHSESSSDGTYWGQTIGSESIIVMHNHAIFLAGSRTLELFNGQNSDGGVFMTGKCSVVVNSGNTYKPRTFISGYGSAADDAIYVLSSEIAMKPMAAASNILADGSFEDGNNFTYRAADWRFINTNWADTTLDTSAGNFDSTNGVTSLKIKPAVGRGVTMIRSVPCGPNAKVRMSGMLKGICTNATDTLTITAQWYDAAGNSQVNALQSPTYVATFNQSNVATYAAFAEFAIGTFTTAPPGAVSCVFTIQTNAAASSGTTTWWLDNFIIEVLGDFQAAPNSIGGNMGSFVPTMVGTTAAGTTTYTTQQGNFWTAGNRCFFDIALTWTGATGTGSIQIGGLPCMAGFGPDTAVSLSMSGVAFTGPHLQARVKSSNNYALLYQATVAGVESGVPIKTSGILYLQGSYAFV
jgi:hypothetical protein